MKIYKYIEDDIDKIKFNTWSRHLKNGKALRYIKQYLRSANSFTIFDEKPIAILSFHEYDKNKFDGCIIADECFGDSPRYAIKMKWLVQRVIKDFNAKRVQTTSEDNEKLNKWHEFLGFKMEKKRFMKDKDVYFNLWSMEWE